MGNLAVVQPESQGVAVITPMTLVQMAVEQNADVEKLEKLFNLQMRWEASEAKKLYQQAMAEFRAESPTILKNCQVNYGKTNYKHADLAGTLKQIQKLMSGCKLSHSWRTEQEGTMMKVTCIITHAQGHSESTTIGSQSDSSGGKNAIQAIGSAVTYLQRYTLFAILGLAAGVDDDGITSEQRVNNAGQQPPEQPVEDQPLPLYTDQRFAECFPGIQRGILDGKITSQHQITKMKTRFTLTKNQIDMITAIDTPISGEVTQ